MKFQKLILLLSICFTPYVLTENNIKTPAFVAAINNFAQQKSWFTFISLADFLSTYSEVKYQECFNQVICNIKPFQIAPETVHNFTFLPCFVLTIPNASVQGTNGLVFKNNQFVAELAWANKWNIALSSYNMNKKIHHMSARVAVIANDAGENYAHWLAEILGRLALIEINEIKYDFLYVPCNKSFEAQLLDLWGIDFKKIIAIEKPRDGIFADTLIVPSQVLITTAGFNNHLGLHPHPYTAYYVRNKLLQAAQNKNINTSNVSKRIFISRKDSPSRKITNEDQIYQWLKQFGFVRYELSSLSVAQQIMLFNNAEIVVGEHGAGLSNCIFCKPGTKVIEIFQDLVDSSYWYQANLFELDYHPIATKPFNYKMYYDILSHTAEYTQAWSKSQPVDLAIIQKHESLFK